MKLFNYKVYLFLLLSVFVFTFCGEDEEIAILSEVEIIEITQITDTSANVKSRINSTGGAEITERGVVWSVFDEPTVIGNDGIIKISGGEGVFDIAIDDLTTETKYYVRTYAVNSVGVSYSEEETFTTLRVYNGDHEGTGEACEDAPTLEDLDGNVYNTVQIGSQCWMAENLKTTTYRDGVEIRNVLLAKDSTYLNSWSRVKFGAYCWYENRISNASYYGALYNWYAVSSPNGICPEGWKVPSYEDWNELIDFLGGIAVAGGKLKATGTHYWSPPNEGATDEVGFNGLPGGIRTGDIGNFATARSRASWWTDTEAFDEDSIKAYNIDVFTIDVNLLVSQNHKNAGFSVRCIKK